MVKKFLSVLLAVMMMFSIVPVTSIQAAAASGIDSAVALSLNSFNDAVINSGGGSVLYSYAPDADGKYVIYSTSDDDTVVSMYKLVVNEEKEELALVTSDDDSGDAYNFRLEYEMKKGETYFFEVKYGNGSSTGTIPFAFGKTYTVTYKSMGGENLPESQIKDFGKDLVLTINEPTHELYGFYGWSTSVDASTVDYLPGSVYSEDANITLYAVWGAINPDIFTAVDLTLNASTEAVIDTADTSKYFKYTPTQDGMYVIYSNSAVDTQVIMYYGDMGIKLAESDNMSDMDDVHYYGEYEEIRDKRFEKDFRLPYYMFADETYYFEVRFKEQTRVGTIPFTFGEAYTVSFDTTGGSTKPSPQIKDYGATLILHEDVPTRVGYAFKGWATSAGSTDVVYTAGGDYAANESVTLYAVWEQGSDLTVNSTNDAVINYAGESKYFAFTPSESGKYVIYSTTDKDTCISLYNSKGELIESSDDAGEGFNMKLSCEMTARERYYFEIKYYDATQTGTIPFNFGKVYTVAYKVDGVDGVFATQEKEYGIDLTLDCELPTKEGYTLKGWSTSATSSTVAYAIGDTYTNEANVTLYAVWELNTYDVTYDANGGENAPAGQVKTHGTELTLSAEEPTREGYTFKGWATSANGAVAYAPGATYTAEEAVTLYAVWEINTYAVTYDANGGENAPAGLTNVYGTTVNVSSEVPVREGHTFLGWRTNTNEIYVAGDSFTLKADTTLYAVWEINTFAVTYNANGGENAPAGQVKTYGIDLTLATEEPTREGYTFVGWAINPNTTTVKYTAGGKYTANAEIVLYAVWRADTYTIKYDANGGKGAPESAVKAYDMGLSISGVEPTRDGYAFLGWATEPDATSATYSPWDIFTDNKDTTLYAVWEKDVVLGANSYNSMVITEAGQSKYFTFTPKESGTYVIYSIVDADTRVYLYNSAGVQIEDDDESGEGRNFRLQYNMTAGTTYRFRIKYSDSNIGVISFVLGEVYTVSYDANGGTGVVYSQSKDYGTELTLRTTKPTRKGYTFLGWSTSASSKKPEYLAGDSLTTNEDTVLYAVWGKNGLEKRADGKWYYVEGGKVVTSKNGLVKHTDGKWYYVKSGVVDKSYTGLCKYNSKWYYVNKGVVDKSYTGLCKYNSKWYYVEDGVVDKSYTGLCKYNSKWYYVNKGVVDKTYTSLCKYNGKWYYINKGVVDKSYTGNVKYNGKTYKVVKGVKV